MVCYGGIGSRESGGRTRETRETRGNSGTPRPKGVGIRGRRERRELRELRRLSGTEGEKTLRITHHAPRTTFLPTTNYQLPITNNSTSKRVA
ncbi:hypothetical protein [Chroococcidiopsis cubana]|uniref:hypothetical protein n=1 Tax=Chroococcidiopsis cubana TaxID=171392 RepID=UPI000F8C925F|nr:hypothetical protein [Chroococcidiopsis cubana]